MGWGGLERWLPVVAVTVLALPSALFVARALERRYRRSGVPAGVARRRSVAEVGMVAGTLPWIWMILTPLAGPGGVHLVPLRDIADQLVGDPMTALVQISANLLVFSALGFFAVLRWGIGPVAATGLGALASGTVETLQYLLDLGRVSSVDDVLLNAAGAGLAALAGVHWSARTKNATARSGSR